jgi:predicted lipid-binding transport protein (Tim44 family)
MKNWLVGAVVVGMLAALTPIDAEARRFGGGASSGMQRNMPAKPAPTSPPATPAQAPAAGATAAAAAPAAAGAAARRSWMGPIAGLAAGLGLAALMSHLGLGEAFANFLMLALLAVAAVFLIRFLMQRFGGAGAKPALAGKGMQGLQRGANDRSAAAGQPLNPVRASWPAAAQPDSMQRQTEPAVFGVSGSGAGATTAATATQPARGFVPAGFDSEGFERIAKMIFIRMQTANDSGDLNDLRNFTTPEMFAAVRMDLQDRGDVAQTTDVVKIEAEVQDLAEENGMQVVSVRFHGLIREDADGAAKDFDEVWHLVKPLDDSRSWAIAGIEQVH